MRIAFDLKARELNLPIVEKPMPFDLAKVLTDYEDKRNAEDADREKRKVAHKKAVEQLRGDLFAQIGAVVSSLNGEKQKSNWVTVERGYGDEYIELSFRRRTVRIEITVESQSVLCNGIHAEWQLEIRGVDRKDGGTEPQFGLFAVDSKREGTRLTTGWRTEQLDRFLAKLLIPSQNEDIAANPLSD